MNREVSLTIEVGAMSVACGSEAQLVLQSEEFADALSVWVDQYLHDRGAVVDVGVTVRA